MILNKNSFNSCFSIANLVFRKKGFFEYCPKCFQNAVILQGFPNSNVTTSKKDLKLIFCMWLVIPRSNKSIKFFCLVLVRHTWLFPVTVSTNLIPGLITQEKFKLLNQFFCLDTYPWESQISIVFSNKHGYTQACPKYFKIIDGKHWKKALCFIWFCLILSLIIYALVFEIFISGW